MLFYKEEKKRIKNSFYFIYQGLFLFFYYVNLNTRVSNYTILYNTGATAQPVPYINTILFFSITILILYLNQQIFWMKEQGKKVFIVRKYKMLPITKQEIYGGDIRIMMERLSEFIIGSIVVYWLTIFLNGYTLISVGDVIIGILITLAFTAVVIPLSVGMNFLQELWGKVQ